MHWNDVLDGVTTLAVGGAASAAINGLEYDSRRVTAGSLFVAMRGETTDGNRYVRGAMEQGAAAVVTDSRETFIFADAKAVPVALVEHGRRALAELSANFFGHPERQLKLTAVTGTNGKTTMAWLTEGLLRAARRRCVLLGTVETHVVNEVRPSAHTTPESRDVFELFADAVQAGATEAVMEMSSHALEQERVWSMPVDVAIFTNLTQDHLDYHGTMERYAEAKARLFRGVGADAPRVAVINAEDPYLGMMLDAARVSDTVWQYAVDVAADFRARDVRYHGGSTEFVLETPFGTRRVRTQLTGRVNVYNVLAAMAAAMARGITLDAAVGAAAQLRPVPGRFETVENSLGITVVVDYAHTDDALRNLIGVARELVGDARVITLFGCGGDRDRTKRPKMGRAAGEGSDVVIVTSDNPRTEDPAAIADEALVGVRETGNSDVRVELDRFAAIASAIETARAGDIVLLAGKGHEKTQTGRGGAVPFDDVAVAAAALRAREARL